ncbi:MAG: recombinase family protein [Bryobacteraceae bacterium]
MERAIAYVRVSTEEQSKEGVSLDAQEQRVKAYARMRGLDLACIYREEGVSANIPLRERPEGAKLVEAITKKRAKHVITVKLDRLFRNAGDALIQSEKWDNANCAVHIVDMGGNAIDTRSAMGRMFFTMAAGFAEMERNLISERTKSALSFKKAERRVYCNITPLGFDRQGDRLVQNREEMKTVKRILRLRAEGLSMQAIADAMNEAGAATKRGGTWHAVTVQKVLRIHESKQAA